MRQLLLGTTMSLVMVASASAADMLVKAPTAAPIADSWTGFYIGANAGASPSGNSNWGFPVAAVVVPIPTTGWLAGGTAGVNYQLGHVVVGFEGDFDAAALKGSNSGTCGGAICSSNITSFATARGRLGWALDDRLLLYATGGAAWGNETETATLAVTSQQSQWGNGWTAGVGLEWAFWNNLSVKVEGLYYSLRPEHYALAPLGVATAVNINETGDILRVGLNYKFNWSPGPIYAKY